MGLQEKRKVVSTILTHTPHVGMHTSRVDVVASECWLFIALTGERPYWAFCREMAISATFLMQCGSVVSDLTCVEIDSAVTERVQMVRRAVFGCRRWRFSHTGLVQGHLIQVIFS